MEKNRDALFPHVYDVLHESSDLSIQACFPEREEVQSKKETVEQVNSCRLSVCFWTRTSVRVDGVNATPRLDAVDAAASYRRDHTSTHARPSLTATLRSPPPRFVRCIKTNSEKQPQKLDKPAVLSQLVCSGVMAALEVR